MEKKASEVTMRGPWKESIESEKKFSLQVGAFDEPHKLAEMIQSGMDLPSSYVRNSNIFGLTIVETVTTKIERV